jgi:hypothetical protein
MAWLYPSVNQTAEIYFTTKVNKKSKAVRDKTGRQSHIQWSKLKVVTNKHEDFISCLQTTEKRIKYTLQGQKRPSKEIAKAQNKDQ